MAGSFRIRVWGFRSAGAPGLPGQQSWAQDKEVPTASGRLTHEDRRQIRSELTRLRRLLTGTLLPHQERDPDDAGVTARIVEVEQVLRQYLAIVAADDQRELREGTAED